MVGLGALAILGLSLFNTKHQKQRTRLEQELKREISIISEKQRRLKETLFVNIENDRAGGSDSNSGGEVTDHQGTSLGEETDDALDDIIAELKDATKKLETSSRELQEFDNYF